MTKNVNRKAVEYFLMSMDLSMKKEDHKKNAEYDQVLYKWSAETLIRIFEGIEDAYKKKET